ncbi:MFS transporter [Pseudonocardia sp. HH130629-09]|uniref:MFS transporter n=1 Tax=Pseudonocardia sp. HH130629-09 TaxID=1641402 RepID=UPI0007DC0B20|nr:MFS transporter [Pseudonocardia sp. HH130629-09]
MTVTTTCAQPGTSSSTDRPWWATALTGAAVIALCYGVARYAYGLFVPRFTVSFGLAPADVGVLGGLSTAGYVLGLLAAPALAARSARRTTLVAGAAAAAGLLLMALAPGVVLFGAGIVVAGAGAGLASPGVAQLVVERVGASARDRAQTWANTGTGAGLALTACTPLLPGDWRIVWLAFGLAAVVVTGLAARLLPRGDGVPVRPERAHGRVLPLLAGAALLGVVSAPYWTFSTARVGELGAGPVVATVAWCAIGLVGLLGGTVGRAVQRYGLRPVGLVVWTLFSVGISLLALPEPGVAGAVVSAGLFGAGFMGLTGLCILWAAHAVPAAPARAVTWAFLALGVGQTLGSPSAGLLAGRIGLAGTFAVAAGVGLLAWAQLHPRLAPPDAGRVRTPTSPGADGPHRGRGISAGRPRGRGRA